MDIKRKKILGFDVDIITFDNAIKYVNEKIKNKEPVHIVTINPEIIESAQNNKELETIIKNAQLVVADGSGIKLALKINGISQERIPGVDLALELINLCNNNNYSIALIGAKEDIIQKTAANLKEKYKNLNIVYYRNGYFSEDEENNITDDIAQKSPDLVIAALGSPKQELFIDKCRKKLTNAIYIGVGGSFDVWSGEVKRAPEIFRKTGFEWLFRTIKQPERIKRIYKTLPVFLFKVIIERVKHRG